MRSLLLTVCLLSVLLPAAEAQDAPATTAADTSQKPVYAAYEAAASKRWESAIAALEKLDQQQTHPDDAVLFVGSSSIRLWDTLAEDMWPYDTIRRGYGGARYSDLAVFAKRLIEPHKYRALVLFVANDVTGGDQDRTPEEVAELLRYVIHVSRAHQPDAPVFVLEVTPTASRWKVWPEIREVNAAMRDVCLTEPNTYLVPTAEYFLDEENQPIEKLFRSDRLHLTHDGYKIWTEILKRRFEEVLQ
ncbi:GDSL-type esterase/lipase family protein [Roseimaritima ulvae]|uniref:SGNH hydrolase-type esterase domain-containing protein n=1 Tax=Roseimaritima ulvae TaxID=980254 RepID=A0A5B9QWG5_9BACT|nr:GDSL-type esterase/lipase family protein [Roseimaritima ulvae]QEG38293.1 hypothetical protein UC8_02490 [Roseimaritima ulvae]